MSVKPEILQTQSELDAFNEKLDGESLIAFDTEFVAEDSYKPELCLVQVATRQHIAIIDPLKDLDLHAFWLKLLDPHKIIVVHAGREEILFCIRASGGIIPGLFDVQIASAFMGLEYPASYGNLVQRFVGKSLGKEETRSDWRQRPLTHRQLEYAAQDVRDLPAIFDILQSQLEKRGRTAWMAEEMERKQHELLQLTQQEHWYRLPGVQSLNGATLAVARAIWKWRETHAVDRNIPARRVLRDDLIIELARRGSDDPKRIANLRGMNHRHVRQHIDALSECIRQAAKDPVPEWPKKVRYGFRQPSSMLTQFLSAGLSYICRNQEIAPNLVGTNEDLRDFALYRLDSKSKDLPPPALLRGWRAEIVGSQLDDLLAGRVGMAIESPLDDNPLRFCRGDASR